MDVSSCSDEYWERGSISKTFELTRVELEREPTSADDPLGESCGEESTEVERSDWGRKRCEVRIESNEGERTERTTNSEQSRLSKGYMLS